MIFTKTFIDGIHIIELEPRFDDRGYFSRVFCQDEFQKAGLENNIVNVNRSFNKLKGTVRGLHFQKEPMAEVKIVQCIKGKIFDVVVDLRPKSPTFKKWFSIELAEDNRKLIYIPKGFAHGIQVLADNSILEYFVTQFYSPAHEGGIRWSDPTININWPLSVTAMSDRDKNLPFFN